MSIQEAPDDCPIWDPDIYREIELVDVQQTPGELVIYDPDILEGRAHIQSDTWVDTYEYR